MSKKKIGLTLSGGGAKGAYQIGVWRALRETGLDTYITSVSGASVGGINAAFFIQGDLEKTEEIWRNISDEVILTPKDSFSMTIDILSLANMLFNNKAEFTIADLKKLLSLSFCTRSKFLNLIDNYLDMDCFLKDTRNCWLACTRIGKSDQEYIAADLSKYVTANVDYFNLNHIDRETIRTIILATSALLFLFPAEKIQGELYVDGGVPFLGGDNVPVAPLCVVDKCDVVFEIHLSPAEKSIVRHKFNKTIVYKIFPSESLGNMLLFDPKRADKQMKLGYNDTIGFFRRIKAIIDSSKELTSHCL